MRSVGSGGVGEVSGKKREARGSRQHYVYSAGLSVNRAKVKLQCDVYRTLGG